MYSNTHTRRVDTLTYAHIVFFFFGIAFKFVYVRGHKSNILAIDPKKLLEFRNYLLILSNGLSFI